MRTVRLTTVVGNRPQFVKAAMVSGAIKRFNDGSAEVRLEETLVHTGQHYDASMSQVFFDELEIPEPAINLGVAEELQGKQTAAMLEGLEAVLLDAPRPSWVLVYGDTNTTLAGTLAAAKLNLPVAHIEAGLRSFDRSAPEEINRVVTDSVSSLLLCPTERAVANLTREGIMTNVHNVGDVMYDSVLRHASRVESAASAAGRHGLAPRGYYLATLHRAENVDSKARLEGILEALTQLDRNVILPLHPRTEKVLRKHKIVLRKPIVPIDPLPYLEMLSLEQDARIVITDSGGVQREAFWLGVPCVTLRETTEWSELVDAGCNRIAGAAPGAILEAVRSFEAVDARLPEDRPRDTFGNGQASTAIVRILAAPT